MRFWIACNPPRSTAQSQRRIGMRGKIPMMYTTSKGKAQEADFMSLLHPFRPVKPYDGSLRLGISYCLPLLKTERKAIREVGWTTHAKRPDGDNLAKQFLDCLGKLLFYTDDSRIVHLSLKKYRSESPGIGVTLEVVTDDEVGDPRQFIKTD
jgi:Holliday junction resolvase RusA-like endonuclease